MHPRLTRRAVLVAGAAGVLTALGCERPARVEPLPAPTPAPPPSPSPPPFDVTRLDPATLVSIDAEGWHSWALMDRERGAIIGSANMAETNRACSMIKSWIAADYLRQKPSPSKGRLGDLDIMIRDSDNRAADRLMNEINRLASFTRMKELCQTTDFKPGTSWSKAVVSARDMCRVGDAIARGAIANPQWTEHLLGLMRTVRQGTWGVREAFPQEERAAIAIKNGWDTTSAQGTYHANCLAVSDLWIMVVLTRYPLKFSGNETHGAQIAQSVASQLIKATELSPLFVR